LCGEHNTPNPPVCQLVSLVRSEVAVHLKKGG
jgi:hypothetical protein